MKILMNILLVTTLVAGIDLNAMKRTPQALQDGGPKRFKHVKDYNSLALSDMAQDCPDALGVIARELDGYSFSMLTCSCKTISEICNKIPVKFLANISFLDSVIFGNKNLFTRHVQEGGYKSKLPNNHPQEVAWAACQGSAADDITITLKSIIEGSETIAQIKGNMHRRFSIENGTELFETAIKSCDTKITFSKFVFGNHPIVLMHDGQEQISYILWVSNQKNYKTILSTINISFPNMDLSRRKKIHCIDNLILQATYVTLLNQLSFGARSCINNLVQEVYSNVLSTHSKGGYILCATVKNDDLKNERCTAHGVVCFENDNNTFTFFALNIALIIAAGNNDLEMIQTLLSTEDIEKSLFEGALKVAREVSTNQQTKDLIDLFIDKTLCIQK